ncbi:hypothetical protein MANES_07G072514v8 [Manihot esculenta]|uniref:Uncharacterized protein n=1 Tax=Manihot esculenta TaxID=3983 RepID=A0ACB7HEC6_MANES|nr:hypothetical protein MANES_07G072514v8 [Manihot esculenta]
MTPEDLAKIIAAINTKNSENDLYHVNNFDAPGFSLVNTPLRGPNYLSWSWSVQIALRAKKKLGFINGKIKAPALDSDDYEKWLTAYSMVVSWLLNAMSKDISDAFVFCKNAKILWDELKHNIAGYKQGSNSVTEYYTSLKKKWDELLCLAPLPVCCETSTAITDYDSNRRLMQFLMGLGDEYDNVKNQILLQDPLPSINKAYSMIMSVEKQRETAAVMLARRNFSGNRSNTGTGNNRASFSSRKEDKKKQYCTNCKGARHIVDDCFSLHGYPDWFIELQKKRGVDVRKYLRANNVTRVATDETPLQQSGLQQKGTDGLDKGMTDFLQQEFQKFLNSRSGSNDQDDGDVRHVNFAGTLLNSVFTSINFNCKDNWIVDSGATDHITPHLNFYDQVVKLHPPKTIRLPDNSTRLSACLLGLVVYLRTYSPNIVYSRIYRLEKYWPKEQCLKIFII